MVIEVTDSTVARNANRQFTFQIRFQKVETSPTYVYQQVEVNIVEDCSSATLSLN